MKIEILYPELCCLYGDKGNTMFLQQCLPEAEFVYTSLNDKPRFLSGDVDLCCMYSMSEQSQEQILSRLLQWKDEIAACLKSAKTRMLLTGNALELLGSYIQREDQSKTDALGIFDYHSVRQAPKRFNSLIQAEFQNMTLLGYTSRFSHTYDVNPEIAMAQVKIGTGCSPDSKLEGIFSGNILGTYLLGPVLVANPDFAKWLLRWIGAERTELPFEKALYESYEVRRKEFQKPDLALD